MLAVRLRKNGWGKAWRAIVETAPVRLVADDPIYDVLPARLEVLSARGFSYEIVQRPTGAGERRRHGTGD
jgi:hypothetical protein